MKRTKAQARKRFNEMRVKSQVLYMSGYISLKDFETIKKIIDFRFKQTQN